MNVSNESANGPNEMDCLSRCAINDELSYPCKKAACWLEKVSVVKKSQTRKGTPFRDWKEARLPLT